MANITFARHDSYLDHLKSGIKHDTLAAVRTAPIHLGSLFSQYGPIYPSNALAIGTHLKGTKNFRKVLTDVNKDLNESLSKKWDQKLNVVITGKDWSKIFKNCFSTIQDNNLIWFQYRTIFRILGTQSLRKKMGKCASNICRLCQQSGESIKHLFVTSEHVKKLWADIMHFSSINQIGELSIISENILLGEWNKKQASSNI